MDKHSGNLRILEKQFVFIVGSPRSGTSWLHAMITAHPAVAGLPHEMTLFSKYLAPAATNYRLEAQAIAEAKWRQGIPLLFTELEFETAMRTMVELVYGRILDLKPEASHIVDKHPHYAGHLELIDRLLPNAKVIHIIRDGRDVAVSTMRTKRKYGHGQASVADAADVWQQRVLQSKKYGVQLGPLRFLELRYEDVLSETEHELVRVFDFLGLAFDREFVSRIAQEHHVSNRMAARGDVALNALRTVPDAIWKSKLMLHERYTFDKRAGELLAQLGYAKPGWWQLNFMDKPRIWRWLFRERMNILRKAIAQSWQYPAPIRKK